MYLRPSFRETKSEWEPSRKCFAGRVLSVGEDRGGAEPGGGLSGAWSVSSTAAAARSRL